MLLSSSKPEVEVDHGKSPSKASNDQPYLDIPLQSSLARSSDPISDISIYSADNEHERRTRGPLLALPPPSWTGKIESWWSGNKGLALVILAQLFSVMMNVTTRLLELDGIDGPGMHPFQILVARMTATLVLSGMYQWLARVEHAPFGSKEVRQLLVARGVGGFFGVYGIYSRSSITFLAPIVTCWACSILVHEPFTRSEQIAGMVSFLGVVLIARPTSLLPGHPTTPPAAIGSVDGLPSTVSNAITLADAPGIDGVTSAQRLGAVGVALVGVLGAACAYTTIRMIGHRAHPLISVNYFAAWATIVSIVALVAVPGIGFRLPANLRQWAYLLFLGVCGFVMQFLLTAGLQHEKSSRATNMVYTQMLFALVFDKFVWNTTPGALSIAGSSLILGSALYVALHNNNNPTKKEEAGGRRGGGGDEEVGLVEADGDEDDNDAHDGRWPLRGVQEVQLRTLRV